MLDKLLNRCPCVVLTLTTGFLIDDTLYNIFNRKRHVFYEDLKHRMLLSVYNRVSKYLVTKPNPKRPFKMTGPDPNCIELTPRGSTDVTWHPTKLD